MVRIGDDLNLRPFRIAVPDEELDDLYRRYKRPIIITEFGAEGVAGLHALPDQMHSEEYQATTVAETIKVIESKSYTAGEHIWNFADFMTAQICSRTLGNRKVGRD